MTLITRRDAAIAIGAAFSTRMLAAGSANAAELDPKAVIYKLPDHIELKGTGGNRSAIGARVEVQWNGNTQVQEVSGGSGFSSQNDRRLHYGLGSATKIDRVVIRWPSQRGATQTIENPAIDTILQVKEPA